MKGVNLITLVYTTDGSGVGFPVNLRVYRHQEGKTKHDYFREMVKEGWQGVYAPVGEGRQLVCLHRAQSFALETYAKEMFIQYFLPP